MNIDNIVNKWKDDETIYKKIEKSVFKVIKKELSNLGIFPEISSRTKELLSIIKKIKSKNRTKEKNYSYEDLKDKLGIRIICTFKSELDIVGEVIKRFFIFHNQPDYKKGYADYKTLDYQSIHYDVYVNNERKEFKNIKQYNTYVFEIQVRTLNQHAWSNASHKLSYKQEEKLPDEYNRKLYRLLALYELADQEIENINIYLKNGNISSMDILSKIEGKFYKYAEKDYGQETTINNLEILKNIFGEEREKIINDKINEFIEVNDKKIQGIFDENRFRFHEMLILTQPEIFVIWFAIENFENILADNWNNHFDYEEFEQAKTLWAIID